jgi:uncharacterized coiled-coil DUF342 family protein
VTLDQDIEVVREALALYENLTAWPGHLTAAAGTHKQAMAAIHSLTSLIAEVRRLREEGQKDYDGMREFQRKFIDADQQRLVLEAQVKQLEEGAANVSMERDMANAEIERLRGERLTNG